MTPPQPPRQIAAMSTDKPTKPQSAPVPAQKADKPSRKIRISPKIRTALRLRVRKALPWDTCAERAGLSPAGLWKARQRPEVDALYQQELSAYVTETESLQTAHKARALEVARNLLEEGKTDAVKARMVEFLRGGSKPGASISVNLQQNFGGGEYFYPPPGTKLVKIEGEADQGAGDSSSPAETGQVIDGKAEKPSR